MNPTRNRWIGTGLLILLGSLYLFNLLAQRDRALWDFKTYYYAARAFQSGQDPYDPKVLTEIAGEEISLPFLYPPFTLVLFLPFVSLPYASAVTVYFVLKLLAIALLFRIWRKFLERDFDFLFFPFALVVFNSAVPLDFASGNISVFEQILLWGGFLFFLRGQLFHFVSLIVIAALFKVTPLFFLVLLFFSEGRKRFLYFTAGLVAFAAIHGAGYLLYPELMTEFSGDVDRILGDQEQRGLWNPSTYALIRDIAYSGMSAVDREIGMRGPFIVFLILGAVSLFLTSWVFWREREIPREDTSEKDRGTICLLTFLYILLVPRLQVYSYLIVIPSAYYFLRRWGDSKVYPISLFFVMSLSARDVFFPGMKQFYSFFWDYSPLLVVFVFWAVVVRSRWKLGVESSGISDSS